jgi:site-specific DNA-methyltransferase (adenine-specific)
MNIEQMKLADIIPYKGNAKKHDNRQIKNVMQSIKEYGIVQPLVIDKNNVLIIGHCRLEASKRLKLTEVPVVRLEELSEEEAQKLRLLDNKLNESEWDMDLLADQVPELNFDDFDIDWGLDIDDTPAEVTEDTVPEEVETRAKLGDLWQLGGHRLICGDSTDIKVIERLMDGIKADMVFTDPPYNVAFNGRSGKFDVIENDDLSENDFRDLITASCNIIRTLNPKEYYIWCNWKFYGILQEQLDYKSCIVWAKNVFGMGKGYRHQHEFCLFNGTIDEGINNESDLWEIAKDTNYVHPTQKPVALCARALKNHKDANVVVDLFGGSGSTLIACEQLNRKCFMCELDPHYVDVIIQRWENLTGEKATLLNDNK